MGITDELSEKQKKLIDFLVDGEFLTEEQVKNALFEAKKRRITLEEALVNKEYISDLHLGQLIAEINNWKFVDLRAQSIDKNIVTKIPLKVAQTQELIAFQEADSKIKVALTNPDDKNQLHLLEKTFNSPIQAFYATKRDIFGQFSVYQDEIHNEFVKIVKKELENAKSNQEAKTSIIQIVDLLIHRGYQKSASDIHLEPTETHTLIRFRIDGVMHDIISIPKKYHEFIISRIKVMAHLRTDAHQIPQDGKLQIQMEGGRADVRVSIVPTTKGENVVMRLLSEKSKQFTLKQLGLTDADYQRTREMIKKPWGMILITGPTGSGKTTSLYGMLKILNRREVNIATIEDPVEYNIDGITQIQVNPKAKLTFSSGLKSIVRQDPDIVMVGEIRDVETANIAINSAMTGHLVLSTLHTNDAATAIPRLHDMEIEPFLVASTLNVVIAQRLLRKICPRCVQSYETDLDELSFKIPLAVLEKLARGKEKILLYRGEGCEACNHTGYKGRTGVFEILEVDDSIRKLIMENSSAEKIYDQAIQNGMSTMFDDAREKVLNGQTTIDEMLRVVKTST